MLFYRSERIRPLFIPIRSNAFDPSGDVGVEFIDIFGENPVLEKIAPSG
ncbi:MAG: hypothetical protein R3A46_02440 [Thermomicrobiales bacterium]